MSGLAGDEPGPTRPAWTWGGWLLLAALFMVGCVNCPLQVLGTHLEYLPGDTADNILNIYILEHGYRCLTGQDQSFWDAPMYYPSRGVTAWSDAHLGMLPVYSCMRAAGLSPERAFQGHFILCFVLNFAAAAWAACRLGFGPVGGAICAYVFAFGLPLSAQLQHTQLYPRFLVPPAIVFAWEFIQSPRASRLVSAAWCLSGQVYLSVYIGYFLAFFLSSAGLIMIVRFPHQLPWRALLLAGWRDWLIRFLGVGTAFLAVLWLADHHRRGGSEVPLEHIKLFSPKPKAWLTPPANGGTYPELAAWTRLGTGMPNSGEQQVCPGLLPLTAVVVGSLVFFRAGRFGGRASIVAVCAVSALLIGLLFTQWGETWYYEPIARLPGARGIRAIGRVGLVLLFPAGVVMGGAADLLVRVALRRGRVAAAGAAILAISLTVADQWLARADDPNFPGWSFMHCRLDRVLTTQIQIGEAIRQHPDARVLYVLPSAVPGGPVMMQSMAMRAAQDAGIPSVNGWSGHSPKGWDFFPDRPAVLAWLTANATSPELIAGLVIVEHVGPPTE